MPAPQQSTIPTFKETAAIPRAQVYDQLHRASNKPGAALADMLGALPGALKTLDQQQTQANQPGPNEQAQLLALAQMGADRDRLRIAKGNGSFMGMLRGEETTLDAYNVERGRREADLFAGQLRDQYALASLHHNADPAAFQAFVQTQQQKVFGEILKDADPAYYHGFLTRIGPVFEEMAKAHAGNLDGFLQQENKRAFETRLDTKMDIELQARAESDSFGIMMDTLMGGESGGNYNAFHGNAGNQDIKFTDMTVAEVLDWQKSGQWKNLGAGSSAVGKYQFVHDTLAEVVRGSGIDPNTKFTPQVQDQLIMYRLLTTRKMQDFLDGKMSAEEFLDNHLSYEFAGLKSTNGRGRYDEDGLNKGNTSAAKTIAALNAYREAYVRDPRSFTDEDGRIDVASLTPPADPAGITTMIDTVEEDFGVPQVQARDTVADKLVERMKTEPDFASDIRLNDLIRNFKLNQEQADRVIKARDEVLGTQQAKRAAADAEFERTYTDTVVQAITSQDPSEREQLFATIGETNPWVANELIMRGDGTRTREGANPAEFIRGLDFNDPYVLDELILGYTSGELDRATFEMAHKNVLVHQQAKPLMYDPVIADTFKFFNDQLPDHLKAGFERTVSDAMVQLIQETGASRLDTTLILDTMKALHAKQLELLAIEQQTIMSRPEYNF